MKKIFLLLVLLCSTCFGWAQQTAKELSKTELAQLVPTNYFFAGQTATTQVRNAGGVRFEDGKLLLLALVDNSGYSTGVAQKYQGLLITEVVLEVNGKTVPPGSYGFGLPSPDHVGILDINGSEIAGDSATAAAGSERAVPLHVMVSTGKIVVNIGKRSFSLARGH